MSTFAAFIIGLLVGWVIEWVIDWIYWRRRNTDARPEELKSCRSRVADLEQEVASYKNQLESLQAERLQADRLRADSERANVSRSASVPSIRETERLAEQNALGMEPAAAHDALETIQGVTPTMAERLRAAGIHTFASLAALIPQKLKEILGGLLSRPGEEVEIIKQARLTSGMIKKVDDLEVIVGIGPVIARTLNNAGIFTFKELAALSAKDLREIVGERIQRLADEDKILSEARQLAEEQDRGG